MNIAEFCYVTRSIITDCGEAAGNHKVNIITQEGTWEKDRQVPNMYKVC